jgi:ribosomal-protein-alanine N-acetyltransferase
MELETERLLLRHWRDSDLAPFAALNAHPDVMRFFPKPLSREESDNMAARVRTHLGVAGWGLWAVEIRNICPYAGFIGFAVPGFVAPFTPCVEIGWRLARAFWRQGYAGEGARAALSHGFGVLGFSEIVSFTTEANLRSRAVMERIGMRRDPAEDFDHPSLDVHHPLRRHVLYRMRRAPASWRR